MLGVAVAAASPLKIKPGLPAGLGGWDLSYPPPPLLPATSFLPEQSLSYMC